MTSSRRSVTRLGLATVLAAGAGVGAAAGADPPRGVFPYPIHETRLANGLRVVLVPMDAPGLLAYWTIVRTGSRDEVEPGRTGFAHFFEHMMFRGTERFPQALYNQAVERMGASANAYTTDDYTAYHLSVAASDLERVMELENDRFHNLAYSRDVFQTEAGAVYGEYRKSRASPFFTAYEALRRAAFVAHTYGHTTIGFEDDIRRMPELYDYSREFFSRFYRPDNIVLLLAGDLDPQATVALIERYYGSWEPGYAAPQVPVEPPQQAERRIETTYEGRTVPILWLSYKAGRFDPADRLGLATSLLADLAFGETSPIHRDLVLGRQLVESIQASHEHNRDPGTLDIIARVKSAESLGEVEASIERTIAQAQEALPDARRLADLQRRKRYEFLLRLDTPARVCSALARIVAVSGGAAAVEAHQRGLASIRPDEIREAARTVLRPERRTVAILREAAR